MIFYWSIIALFIAIVNKELRLIIFLLMCCICSTRDKYDAWFSILILILNWLICSLIYVYAWLNKQIYHEKECLTYVHLVPHIESTGKSMDVFPGQEIGSNQEGIPREIPGQEFLDQPGRTKRYLYQRFYTPETYAALPGYDRNVPERRICLWYSFLPSVKMGCTQICYQYAKRRTTNLN